MHVSKEKNRCLVCSLHGVLLTEYSTHFCFKCFKRPGNDEKAVEQGTTVEGEADA